MFIWSTNNILKQIKKFSPDTYNALKEIEDIDERCLKYLIKSQYKETEAISIDYAVMESQMIFMLFLVTLDGMMLDLGKLLTGIKRRICLVIFMLVILKWLVEEII